MRRVVALHCTLASGSAWRGIAWRSAGTEVIAPDLPGHGAAPDWDRAQDYQTQALALALDAAGEGPAHVVGHSFGATLALRLLVERPDLVLSLALVEPVMFAAAGEAALTDYWIAMAPFEEALADGRDEDAARHFHREWGGAPRFDDLPEPARASIARRIGLVAAQEPSIVSDVHGILPRLPAEGGPPVLIVTREAPPPIVAAIVEGLVARMPGARVERLGQGHMIPMEEPEALASLLEGHWAAAEGAG